MKEQEVFNIEIYGEVCCEFCNDIARNRFNCPCCNNDNACSCYYGEIHEETTITCEECHSEFETIDGSFLSYWETNKMFKIN